MTLPERSLHPASGDDRRTLLSALEFVACRRVQLCQVVGAVVGHGVPLEPSLQVLHRIEVGRLGRQKGNLEGNEIHCAHGATFRVRTKDRRAIKILIEIRPPLHRVVAHRDRSS